MAARAVRFSRLAVVAGGLVGLGVLGHSPASAQPTRTSTGVSGVTAFRAELGAVAATTANGVPITDRFVLAADRDDDDADDVPDSEATFVSPAARTDLLTLDAKFTGAILRPISGIESARIVAAGRPIRWGERAPAGAQIQGVTPGRAVIVAERPTGGDIAFVLDVHGVGMRDGANKTVDLARERASLERTPPTRIDLDDADQVVDDPDALRVLITSPENAPVLGDVSVESLSSEGVVLDAIADVRLVPVACAERPRPTTCWASAPIRFVVDDVDRSHVLVAARSVRAEVGGAIVIRDASHRKLQAIRVAGPRVSPVGPIGRHRLTVRPVVMRLTAGGAPAVGGTDAGALAAIRQELSLASAIWGQCGITFGPVAQMDVKVVSPPPPYLVAVGDDVGLPASGGVLRFRVEGKPVAMTTKKGWSTRQAALELQRAVELAGFAGAVSENARIAPGAAPSVDVAVKKRTGELASVELVSSSDATLSVRVGAVDLTDGLQHFGDTDSVAGTLEERALVKAIDDGDPRTIEVIVVPFFAGGGRIGESFIGSDGSSMRNVVIIDRAGVRARRTSLTLAHELGHVILDEPGHPDDYGVDTPSLLMDSDASDSSPFGPRRLTLDECGRAIRQSGPAARLPLLTDWKLGPMKYSR